MICTKGGRSCGRLVHSRWRSRRRMPIRKLKIKVADWREDWTCGENLDKQLMLSHKCKRIKLALPHERRRGRRGRWWWMKHNKLVKLMSLVRSLVLMSSEWTWPVVFYHIHAHTHIRINRQGKFYSAIWLVLDVETAYDD